ncbi:MAG: hypothetical protein IKI28_01815 [Bacteroidales bacterium]|nr:hypothetical protein [Bacteroidales bacterium]
MESCVILAAVVDHHRSRLGGRSLAIWGISSGIEAAVGESPLSGAEQVLTTVLRGATG